MSETASSVQPVGASSEDGAPINGAVHVTAPLLRFGVFELDVETGELRKEGRLIHLRLQPVSVLRLLLERAGSLVTRREITNALWSDDLDVDVEQGLNHCMKEIRAALGDRPESPRFIQTLPRRGYRFLIEVRNARAVSGPNPAPVAPESTPVIQSAEVTSSAAPEPTVTAVDSSGLRVKIVVTDPRDETILWSETREGHGRDLETLERQIGAALSAGLKAAVSSNGDRREALPPARDRRFE